MFPTGELPPNRLSAYFYGCARRSTRRGEARPAAAGQIEPGFPEDSKTILAQCMVENEIATFTFDGKTLTKTAPIAMKAGPAVIRTAEP